MRRLILFRHAKSDWSPEGQGGESPATRDPWSPDDDHDRPLAARGRRAAGPMGAWLAGRGFRPDLVLCSTARRARATWELAKAAFSPSPKTKFDADIYHASPDALLQAVKGAPADVQTLMIVGHNPGFEQFVELLASKGDPEARRSLAVKFPTAAIAVLDFPFDDWISVAPGAGRLDRFATPKALGIGEA